MGLLDVFTGMANGPRGGGFGGGGRSSGMSPILLAALGLLAYKAVKGIGSAQQRPAGANGNAPNPPGGGLGGILQNLGLGGLGGAAAGGGPGAGFGGGLGGILSGGLGDLLKQFQNAGKADVADSWVGTGPNRTIAPTDLSTVLTPEQIAFLMERTGLSRQELLEGLSQQLPEVVDKMTPQGRLPAPQDFERG